MNKKLALLAAIAFGRRMFRIQTQLPGLEHFGVNRRAQTPLWHLVILSLLFCCALTTARAITVDGTQTNQVVDGFGVNVNFRSWNGAELQPVLDAFIDQAGMTLFRVAHDLSDWEATNDNTNANSINWDYFNGVFASGEFPKLWDIFAYLNSRGITNGAYFCFMGWGPSWMMDTDGHTLMAGMEEEWAETITAAVLYARNTRGLQFSLLAPDNEPEQDAEGIRMSVPIYTNALHRLALKLDANGLGDLRLVGPDTILDPSYLPAMLADPVVMAKVGRVGLHSYGGAGQGSTGIAALLTNSPYPSLPFWMTEFNVSCSTCDSGTRGTYDWNYCEGTAAYLLYHLLNGASGGLVWEGYDSVYAHHGYVWSYWGLFAVDDETAPVKTYTPRKNFYTLSQITKWVRPGAQRIGVTGADWPFVPLVAFKHPASGQVTLVGINTDTSADTLSGTLASLPGLTHLDLFYTTATTNLASGGSVAVSNGVFSALIPADCIFTLTGTPGAPGVISAMLTAPAPGAQFAAPANIPLQAAVLPATASIALVEFYQGATLLGQVTNAPYAITWQGAPMGDYVLTARVHDTGGNVTTSAVVQVTVTGPLTQIRVTPTNSAVVIGGTLQFLATGTDALGHLLAPSWTWAVSGGGTISSNGLFSAAGPAGYPYLVSATSGSVTGLATVLVTNTTGPITTMLTAPASGARFAAPANILIQATVVPASASIALVEFFRDATKLGEVTNAPYAITWQGAPMGDYALTARVHQTGGNITTSAVVQVTVTGPLAQITVTPSTATVAIGGAGLFQATGNDALGHVLAPAFAWSVSGGGTISSNGLFSASGLPGYLYYVTAASGSVTGLATVIVSTPIGVLGNSNDGSLADSLYSKGAWIHACRFGATNSFAASLIFAKVAAIVGHYKCAVYSDNAGMPGSFLAGTAEVSSPATGWQPFPLTSSLAITNGGWYWLAIWSDSPSAQAFYQGMSGNSRWGLYNYGPWPATLSTSGGSGASYCIYAASAGSVLSSIALVPANLTLFPSGTGQLAALGIFSNGATTNLTAQTTWSSSNPSVASVTPAGLVTGVSPGSATISASLLGLTGSVSLAVAAQPLIQTIRVQDGTATVLWSALPNYAYRLQYRDDLSGSNWVDLLPDVIATGTAASGTNLLDGQPVRFYRVRVVP
jgi:O-glycosyl hydrolase